MVLEILDGLVIVCGPVTTTNLTFAERILGECPRVNKRLVPFPEALLTHNSVLAQDSKISDRLDYTHSIDQAYRNKQFTVCAGCYPDLMRLESFLYRLRMMRISFDVTMVKLIPKSSDDLDQATLQRYHDFMKIAQRNFHETIYWVKREYVVDDPSEIELKFL